MNTPTLTKIIFLTFLLSTSAHAFKAPWLDDLLRRSLSLGDDIPLAHSDEVLKRLRNTGTARGKLDELLPRNLDDAARKVARAHEVTRMLKAAAAGADTTLLKHLDELDEATREALTILTKGSREIAEQMPDLALRGRMLKAGGTDMVAAVGLHGKPVSRAVLQLDAALSAGKVVVPAEKRAVTLADFGRVMHQTGNASWSFWQKYVLPHWKEWLASGALTAYLLEPEKFQDALGNLTEAGFAELTALAGAAAAGSIRGIGKGSEEAAKAMTKTVQETYLQGWQSVYAIVGTLVLLFLLSLMFPRVRRFAGRPLRWLMQTPKD